jgi:hypothetical protein
MLNTLENLLPNIACVVNAKETMLLRYDDPTHLLLLVDRPVLC